MMDMLYYRAVPRPGLCYRSIACRGCYNCTDTEGSIHKGVQENVGIEGEQADGMIITAGEWLITTLRPAEKRLHLYHTARVTIVAAPIAALAMLLCYRWWRPTVR